MAVEDFTTFQEVDPNTRIAKTATRVTCAAIAGNEDAYVYYDKGVDYFDGDFTHYLTINMTAGDGATGRLYLWGLTNLIDDMKGIDDAGGDYLALFLLNDSPTAQRIFLEECYGGQPGQVSYSISLNTPYYIKIVRDETPGNDGNPFYGTLYFYIYSDAARTTLLTTLSKNLYGVAFPHDFRYLFAANTWNDGSITTVSGYMENLNTFKADAGYAATYPTNTLLRTSGIVRSFWAGIGGQSVYQATLTLGGISTTFVSPISKREPESAVTPTQLPSGVGYQLSDYALWLSRTTPDVIQSLFGHQPTFTEWVTWKKESLKQGFVPWSF